MATANPVEPDPPMDPELTEEEEERRKVQGRLKSHWKHAISIRPTVDISCVEHSHVVPFIHKKLPADLFTAQVPPSPKTKKAPRESMKGVKDKWAK